jgi:RNA 2',3'-cyclic 3'-phosphodiesterase
MIKDPHYFVALRLPLETKLALKENSFKLKESLSFSRWEHHEDLHVTLAFLGSAKIERLQLTKTLLKEALRNSPSFNLNINELGAFGKGDNPRVLWADLSKEEKLLLLREIVFHACEQAGFILETRPFRPHITLARKWNGMGPFHCKILEMWNAFQPEPITFRANEVVIYQTHLDKLPKYEVIDSFALMDGS